ncbi:MAG TPA: sulfotransferase, partial [Thermoleophilaceae bacterium]|nr:sulfotransferase [Thermoleophilaceae bacterium]
APRSGTTLLRLMLDAHPRLAIPPETYFIPKAAKRWRHASGIRSSAEPREAFYETVTGHKRWPDFHLDADDLRRRLEEERPRELGDAVRAFYRLYADKVGAPQWGDKTPFYVRRMELIQEILPEARFVHIIRDGRAVTLSIKDLWFGPDSIEEAAEFWIERIGEGREQAPRLEHYMEVRYEDVVRDPEPQLRRICDFLDLPWDPRVARYHEHVDERIAMEVPPEEVAPDGRVVSTAERQKIMERVSRPPDPSRIDRWRVDMPEDDRRKFEAIAGDLLAELGYERDSTARVTAPS